jgi:hypothetical protein
MISYGEGNKPCTEDEQLNGWLIKRICLSMLCFIVVLTALMVAYITLYLSGRALGVAVILSAVIVYFPFVAVLRKAKERNRGNPEPAADERTRKRLRLSIRYFQIYWASLVLGLIIGLLDIVFHHEKFERDEFWAIPVVLTMNLLMQYVMFLGIRKTKQRLGQSQAGGSLEQSHR